MSLPTPAVLCGSVKSRREHGQKMQAKHAVAKAVAPSLLSVKPQLSSSRICLTAPPAMPALGLLQLLTAAPARHHLASGGGADIESEVARVVEAA